MIRWPTSASSRSWRTSRPGSTRTSESRVACRTDQMTEPNGTNAAIRTPDQRLRVFVSSTLAELAEERAAVSRAISAVGLTPVLFELGARPHPPQELYRAYLAQSHSFIGPSSPGYRSIT